MNSVSHLPFLTLFMDTVNGCLCYLPTAEWEYGGYKVETLSPFKPLAAKNVTESVVVILKADYEILNRLLFLKLVNKCGQDNEY